MASGGIALGLAVLATAFVLGRGPGSLVWMTGTPPTWMPFAGAGLSWVPFASDLEWLPFNEARPAGAGTRSAAGGPNAALTATAVPSPSPSSGGRPGPSPEATRAPALAPAPSAKPSASATRAPEPVLSGTPTPAPTPATTLILATPTPTPTATPTPALVVATPTPTAPTTPVAGATLFAQTFETDLVGSTQPIGMTVLSGTWKVITDSTHDLQDQTEGTAVSSTGATWQNYRVTAGVKAPSGGHAYVVTRAQDAGHFYACGLDGAGNLFLGKLYGGSWYTFSSTPFAHSMNAWYTITSTVSNNSLTCTVTDPLSTRTATVTATESYFGQGPAGFAGSPGAEFDNLLVSSI